MSEHSTSAEEGDGLEPRQVAAVVEALEESRQLYLRMAGVVADLSDEPDVDAFLEARAQIGILFTEANEHAQAVAKIFGLGSAQERMMHYLRLHVAEPVAAGALAGASCIWEWARRKRQLNVEHGWEIVAGPNEELGLEGKHYMLIGEDRDEEAAGRWQRNNRIRRQPGSGLDRMLALLREAYPEPVTREDLDYVSKIRSRDRRKRDLQEAGWRISSYEEDPSLASGEYRLDALEKGPPRAREYIKLRQEILQRDEFTCQQCGARSESGERILLHVHHKRFVSQHGGNDPENLETLCRACHAGKHAAAETVVDDELLNPAADPYVRAGD